MAHLHLTKLFVIMFLLPYPFFATAPPDRSPETVLQVSVFNDAHVSPVVLTDAETRASAVLSQAGIHVDWLDCSRPTGASPGQFRSPSPCARIAFPAHLSVRVVPRAFAATQDTFGQSFFDDSGIGAYANIYYDRVASFRGFASLREGDLLGYIFAHEIGHLLLGPNSHSISGVMCARWSPEQLALASRGLIFFTPAQSFLMRSRLTTALVLQPLHLGSTLLRWLPASFSESASSSPSPLPLN